MIYIVVQYCGGHETITEMVTTDYEKACKCLDEDLKNRFIEAWKDGAREGKRLD